MGSAATKTFGDASTMVLKRKVDVNPNGILHTVIFGAGCFWGVELAFQRVPGVVNTEVGYTQGFIPDPTYENVCTGSTGHVEAVKVDYDPEAVSMYELLTVFWDIHDPTTMNRQGNDTGTQYRSGIYYYTEEQKKEAFLTRDEQQRMKYGDIPIVTEILPAKEWYKAEEYHQKYLEKGGQCALSGDLTPIRCYG